MNIRFGIIKHFGDLKTEAVDVTIVYGGGMVWQLENGMVIDGVLVRGGYVAIKR